jgi:hypothetical protein
MSPGALQTPVDRISGRRGLTAFEREVLPGFSRWVVERIEQLRPDYLVPVETKGARLLEAVLAYAEEEMGFSPGVPLIYGTALAYHDREELRDSRVLVLDDALRTGRNFRRHRERLERYGASDVSGLVFMSYAKAETPVRKVESYRDVDERFYNEYLWQLAELVISRGLPPEVDHQLFALRVPGRLPVAWDRLREALRRFGTLNVDGPVSRDEEELLPMTLHFPRFPGARQYPVDGDIRNEGANKVRFFPDVASGQIVVVPISFPTLDLPAGTSEGDPVPDAAERVRGWAGPDDPIAELLVESVRTPDPEAVFRMLSAWTEVELMRGLARVLPAVFPEDESSIVSLRGPLGKLYGHEVGDAVAVSVDEELRAAAEEAESAAEATLSSLEPSPLVYLTPEIGAVTQAVIDGLRTHQRERASSRGPGSGQRIGRTLSEIVAKVPGKDPLLGSRCVGYGLAMTSIVPYVRALRLEDGVLSVRREYRLSERDDTEDISDEAEPQPYPDPPRYSNINGRRRDLSEQVVALIATFAKLTVPGWEDRPVPLRLVAELVAILQPLVLVEEESVKLHVVPGEREPTIVLNHDTEQVELASVTSSHFELCDVTSTESGIESTSYAVEPTVAFRQAFDGGYADIQLCGAAAQIESWLERLVPKVVELDRDAQQPLLAPWAMSTDKRLGLTHVFANLRKAFQELERPLNLALRRQPHERSLGAARRADYLAMRAGAQADMLKRDWSEPVREAYVRPLTRGRMILDSLGAPSGCGSFGRLPLALIDLTSALSGPVDRLDEMSTAAWIDGEEAIDGEALASIVRWSQGIAHALTSLGSDPPPEPSLPSGRAGVYLAARELKRSLALVEELAAAAAGSYRGAKGARMPEPEDARAATVLSLDIAGSVAHGRRNSSKQSTGAWKNRGLNIVAQWGLTFNGWEGRDRQGDLVWLEFADRGDAAVIAAAAIQQHMQALRSTGDADESWAFRCAVDDGDLQGADGGNTHGECLDRVSRVAKAFRHREDSIERVYIAEDAARRCSALVTDELSGQCEEDVALIDATEDAPAVTVRVRELDTAAVLEKLAEGMTKIADEIKRQMPPGGASLATELESLAKEAADDGPDEDPDDDPGADADADPDRDADQDDDETGGAVAGG